MILLDTHIVIWLANDSPRLGGRQRQIVKDHHGEGLAISPISLYEIAWLTARNRIALSESLDRFLSVTAARFALKPLTPEIAATAAQLPTSFPSDPFDRIIAATAIVEGIPLLTADRHIRRSKAVRTIW